MESNAEPIGPIRPRPDGTFPTEDRLAAAPFPRHADPAAWFTPRGAQGVPDGPVFALDLVDRDRVAPPETGRLYDQAVAAVWDPSREVPWGRVGRLAPNVDAALSQVMTHGAATSAAVLSTLARFVPRLPGDFFEVSAWLATAMAAAARDADAFVKRACLAGGPGPIDAIPLRAWRALADRDDFLETLFVSLVLHDGTFHDVLRFVADHAPDEATSILVAKVRIDVARRAHFGVALVRHAIAADARCAATLQAVAAACPLGTTDPHVAPSLLDALAVLAAHHPSPPDPQGGRTHVQALLVALPQHRVRRLVAAGFSVAQARSMSAPSTQG